VTGRDAEAARVFQAAARLFKAPADTSGTRAVQAAGKIRVFRFCDRNNPDDLIPNLWRNGTEADIRRVTGLARFPEGMRQLAELHVQGVDGRLRLSPFVSVTSDPQVASRTRDGLLREIIRTSPERAEFDVPRDLLHTPQGLLATDAAEMLYLGNDLADHLVRWERNPYRLR
jgi:hypothetical protein